MNIKEGTILNVNHHRFGKFIGKAMKDFDTDKEEFYPICVHQDKPVKGLVNVWITGLMVII